MSSSLQSEALHTVLATVTVTHGRASPVVQIVSADKPVIAVPTITNVVQARSVVMATVCQCALLLFQAILLFGPEVLLPAL